MSHSHSVYLPLHFRLQAHSRPPASHFLLLPSRSDSDSPTQRLISEGLITRAEMVENHAAGFRFSIPSFLAAADAAGAPIESSTLPFYGFDWRLDVRPGGNGAAQGTHASVFLRCCGPTDAWKPQSTWEAPKIRATLGVIRRTGGFPLHEGLGSLSFLLNQAIADGINSDQFQIRKR